MAATSTLLSGPVSLPSHDNPVEPQRTTLLITTFAGLGLPRTLSVPVAPSTPVSEVLTVIYNRLPATNFGHSLLITTTSNKLLRSTSQEPISAYLSSPNDAFLPLRLSARLCGGKGGFGSQLRAAGGRMSSKKNRDRQNATGSNRNLDGRRLRTIDEAKRLAEYLATKPDMERKEREEKRKRWEAVIAAAEATEAKIKEGKMGSNQGRLDAEYVEGKEVAEEKIREAVARAMREGMLQDERTGSESSEELEKDGSADEKAGGSSSSGEDVRATEEKLATSKGFFGWDEDDEDMSSEDEDMHSSVAADAVVESAFEGKGKAKAV